MESISILYSTTTNARVISMVLNLLLGDLPQLLRMPFFQMALVGGCLISLICSTMGLFIVLRKESMIGDSVVHTAFGGIALGLLLGTDPIFTAMIISILSFLGISYMRSKGIVESDSAMAVMLAGEFSLGQSSALQADLMLLLWTIFSVPY
jgi:zinc transport system permease protein